MKLNEGHKTIIWQEYDKWMHSYLNADVATYNSYFDEDYHFIGSTGNEEFLNRKDTTAFFKETGDQFAGMTDLRNETKTLEVFGAHVFITHFFDAWFKNEKEWTYYGRFRFSSVMHKTKEGWRFIYQHFSMPDSKSEEGQTIGFDKVKSENEELREAIKRRTIELEAKNRELEIESALDRIRAQAVAMQKSSDLLDIVVTMRNEFIKLGHEAHYFWHMMWLPNTYEKAMTSGDGSRIGFVMELPRHIHGDIPLLAKWEKSKKSTVVYAMDANEAIAYVDKMVNLGDFKNIDPQAPSHDDIRHIGGLTFIMARTTHGEIGYSLPGIVKNPPKEDIAILVQFAGAFDLAHRRFLDLKKAEKQTRETQIELAIEKVRSRTMAMQHSDELQETSFLLDQEVRGLGIKTWGCAFSIYGENESTEWFGNEAGVLPTYTVPRKGVFKDYYQKGKKGESLYIKEFEGEKCVAHYEYMSSLPVIGDILKELKKSNNGFPTYQIDHVVYFKYGYLLFITKEHVPDAHDVFKRFAKVFEQTYTRFLDLQKSEAQAREAQIQLSLERVRAKSMAMQSSDELHEVIGVVFRQFDNLEIHPVNVFLSLFDRDKRILTYRASGKSGKRTPTKQDVDIDSVEAWSDLYNKWINDSSDAIEVIFYPKEIVPDILNLLKDTFLAMPKADRMTTKDFPKGGYSTLGYTPFGYLGYDHTRPPSEEEKDILNRICTEFGRVYQRFLDLQKAEAQAKEAKIEAALERVRSRSMAMHISSEIGDVAAVLFEQLKSLGGELWGTGFGFCTKDSDIDEYWFATEEGIMPQLKLPHTVDPVHKQMYENWTKGLDLFSIAKDGQELKDHYDYMLTVPDVQPIFQGILDAGIAFPNWQKWHAAYFKYGYLLVITTEIYDNEIVFTRFAKVFEQAYTRFLDLQKAEVQAKEAKIEAALERVRSKSLAMHHSSELSGVVDTLLQEFTKLEFTLTFCIINIINEDDNSNQVWAANPETGKDAESYYMKFEDYAFHDAMWHGWKTQQKKMVYVMQGKEKKTYDQYLYNETEFKRFPIHVKEANKALEKYVVGFTFSKFGGLQTVSEDHISEADLDILSRFGKAFDQTYTRFLDLQKAEAQAKEAQIEAALERVRSRSMAMHQSDELKNVIQVIYDQFVKLNITIEHAGFILDYKNNDDMHIWLADKHAVFPEISLPYFDCAHWNSFKKAKKNGKQFFANQLGFEEKNKFYNDLFKYIPDLPEDTKKTYLKFDGLAISTVLLESIGLYIENYSGIPFTAEENAVLMRFGKVFQQTYTRFRDLQKAEAQAREAQVELGLERVRARAMAMQTSNELSDLVNTLFKELVNLDFKIDNCIIWIFDPQSLSGKIWIKNHVNNVPPNTYLIKNLSHKYYQRVVTEWQNRNPKWSYVLEGSEKIAFDELIFTETELQLMPKHIQKHMREQERAFVSFSFSNFGGLQTSTEEPLSESSLDILSRFGKVFDLTYTRFNDLKHAEAQAREAQINLAVERVRAKALAMHKSEEIMEVVAKLKDEVMGLDISGVVAATIFLEAEDNHVRMWDLSSLERSDHGYLAITDITFKLKKEDSHLYIKRVWESTEDYYIDIQNAKDLDRIIEFMYENNQLEVAKEIEEYTKTTNLKVLYHATKQLKKGKLCIDLLESPPDEMEPILNKMGAAFDLAYKRFEDIKKAEAQAKEAQIEAALEKVRSHSLAMQSANDLKEVVVVIVEKLKELGVILDANGITLCTYFKDSKDIMHWIASPDLSHVGKYHLPYFDHPILNEAWNSKDKGDSYFSKSFSVEIKNSFFKHAFENSDYKHFPEDLKTWIFENDQHTLSFAWQKNSALLIPSNTGMVPTGNEKEILIRFSKVFEQAYIRFMDLQKAEAQAREAQIEAALERIRSRSMGMQKSEDLAEVVRQTKKEVIALGIHVDNTQIATDFTSDPYDGINDWISVEEKRYLEKFHIPFIEHPVTAKFYETLQNNRGYFTMKFSKAEKNAYFKLLFEQSDFKNTPEERQNYVYSTPGWVVCGVISIKSSMQFARYNLEMFSHKEVDVFKRFGKVFEQAYTRFLDLQKAEAQTREAQIEAALERIRAKAMSMQNSDELDEVLSVLCEQFDVLGVVPTSTHMTVLDLENNTFTFRETGKYGNRSFGEQTVALDAMDNWKETIEKWKADEATAINKIHFPKEQLPEVWNVFHESFASMPEDSKITPQDYPDGIYHTAGKHPFGYIGMNQIRPATKEEEEIVLKFANEFGRTYQRFLDLQKAEAQAREAQVETALEKVRSRTMAMQDSNELKEVVVLLYKELINLDVTNFVSCGYVEVNEETERQLTWVTNPGGDSMALFYLPLTGDDTFDERYNAWKAQQTVFHQAVAGKRRKEHLEYAITTFQSKEAEEMVRSQFPDPTVFYCFNFSHGYLHLVGGSLLTKEEEALLARFTKVFEQTYARFLDLKKSEAQTREAQIEMALEKVRSRTMAMQHSNELPEAANVLFTEIQNLGIPAWSCGYNILSDDKKSSTCIMSSEGEIQSPFILPLTEHKSLKPWHKAILNNEAFFVYEQGGKDLVNHYKYMQSLPELTKTFEQFKDADIPLPTFQVNHLAKFTNGFLLFITYERVPEAHDIFQRFAKVFEQTYTRFLDLQKAEAQAREAQVEAALERVRSHAMGMQSTDDFGAVTTEMFNQLRHLGENLFATGIVFCDKHNDHVEQWHSIPGAGMLKPFIVPINLDYIHQYRYDQWKKGEELFSIEIPSDFIEQHFEDIFNLPSAQLALKDLESRNTPMPAAPPWEIDYGASFSNGYILASSLQSFENTEILPRFAKVFEQAYTRFLDLQKAETRAREAQIEMALEKVRSRTMAMESSKELAETSVIVFKQLLELGISPNRLFIGIVNEKENAVEAWATNEDGSKIEQHFELFTSENKTIKKMVDGWKKRLKTTIIDLKGKELQEYFHYLNKVMNIPFIDGLKQTRRVQTIAYFSGGLIGMAAPEEQPKETLELLERFAAVFNLTYTRFKDLKIAEANTIKAEKDLIKLKAAKKRAEKALSELQTTQTQLIQAEKMASLGELTAGIAHEIQNPLNFVNNFSEVSEELLEELLEELADGDLEEVQAITKDIIENLKKINHHGKRADGIVKGMLQHSRTSSAEKEPTDINKLADEYLRLAYHGLRAKDKSFNATLVTDFDESIEEISIISQDFGRVIVNLITNAFYACNEKKISGISNYEPIVTVSTKNEKGNISISVKDNGNGIPEHLKEKIFQPFFTTKPTGQGTGLGLSLSYDIIKAHNGSVTIDSKENEGTTFSIVLPFNS